MANSVVYGSKVILGDEMIIRQVGKQEPSVVNAIVTIHLETFTGFFLTFMGKGFLRQMYSAYTTHDKSGLLVAFVEDQPVGFLAFSGDMSGLYKHMIKTRLIPFAWFSLGALLRKPKVFVRLLRAFLKPAETKRNEEYIELSSIGVKPDVKAKGIGTELINELKKNFDSEKYAYIALETDATNNDAVNRFYESNGFKLVREYETPEGRKMNEYRWQ